MLLKLLAVLPFLLLFGSVSAQPGSHPPKAKLKTIRLHIDGFQKSKSGAV